MDPGFSGAAGARNPAIPNRAAGVREAGALSPNAGEAPKPLPSVAGEAPCSTIPVCATSDIIAGGNSPGDQRRCDTEKPATHRATRAVYQARGPSRRASKEDRFAIPGMLPRKLIRVKQVKAGLRAVAASF